MNSFVLCLKCILRTKFTSFCVPCDFLLRLTALASNEANMIRTEKAHLVELEKAKLSEDQMRSKLEESQVVCDGVQRTLASLVAEKERLTAELFDMKQMCEELMAMVEGQSGG